MLAMWAPLRWLWMTPPAGRVDVCADASLAAGEATAALQILASTLAVFVCLPIVTVV